MAYIIAHRRASIRLGAWSRLLREQIATDCPLCGLRAAAGHLCRGCASDLTWSMRQPAPRCARCALRLPAGAMHCADCIGLNPAFTRTIAALDYEPPADALVALLKSRLRYGTAQALAALLATAVCEAQPGLPAGTLLLAVPSSLASLTRRGFNPAGEIARALAPMLGIRRAGAVLRRGREGLRQAAQGRQGRLLGTRGLYYCARPLDGVPVAVVDDVMTTGSTLDAAARAALRAGAASVTALVVARAPA